MDLESGGGGGGERSGAWNAPRITNPGFPKIQDFNSGESTVGLLNMRGEVYFNMRRDMTIDCIRYKCKLIELTT